METAKCRTFHTGRLLFSAERVLFDVSTDYLLTGRSFETLHIQKLQADGSWREKLHERRLFHQVGSISAGDRKADIGVLCMDLSCDF